MRKGVQEIEKESKGPRVWKGSRQRAKRSMTGEIEFELLVRDVSVQLMKRLRVHKDEAVPKMRSLRVLRG